MSRFDLYRVSDVAPLRLGKRKEENKNMFKEIIDQLKKKDEKEDSIAFRVYHGYKENILNFIEFLIEYFEFSEIQESTDFSSRAFLFQESSELNYIMYLLKEIKKFVPLIFKISQDFWLVDKIKKSNLKDESIINMIENFVSLERTGRKRKFYNFEVREFQDFKEKNQNIIEYGKEIESWKQGSILDFAKAISKFNLKKEELRDYINKFNFLEQRTKEWSRATKYRFDSEFPRMLNTFNWIKDAFDKFDFYKEIAFEHKSK
ncbi:MAG: hypothetical protein ACFFAN_16640 [Promethearchaeota archaeon]